MKRSMWTWLVLNLGSAACGTDAVGVSECRRIESARCEAAVKCGSVEDLDQCNRYFEDHCLHGLAIGEAPRAKVVTECVSTIQAAGTCAKKYGAKTAPDDCDSNRVKESDARQICDLVDEPERAPLCSFLVPDPDEEKDDEDEDEDPAQDAGSRDPDAEQTSGDGG
jgi:hypothetical protein